jgi:hypothetical protein
LITEELITVFDKSILTVMNRDEFRMVRKPEGDKLARNHQTALIISNDRTMDKNTHKSFIGPDDSIAAILPELRA